MGTMMPEHVSIPMNGIMPVMENTSAWYIGYRDGERVHSPDAFF